MVDPLNMIRDYPRNLICAVREPSLCGTQKLVASMLVIIDTNSARARETEIDVLIGGVDKLYLHTERLALQP